MGKKTLTIIIIAAVVLAGAVLVYWIFFVIPFKTSPGNTNQAAPLSTTGKEQADVKHFEYEPGAATVLNGTVENIDTSAQMLMVKSYNEELNPVFKGKTFAVVIADKTLMKRLSGAYSIIKKNNQTEIVSLGSGTSMQSQADSWPVLVFTDFKIGDTVIVLSEQGISDQDSFVAKAVYKK